MHGEFRVNYNGFRGWLAIVLLGLLLTISGCGERWEKKALSTNAPANLTIEAGASQEFAIEGGKSPYVASSNNTSVAVVGVVGSQITVGGVASGSAEISIRDSEGETTTINVLVAAGTQRGLFTTAPSNVTVAAGAAAAQTYRIAGGTAPYSASSSNAGIASAAIAGSFITVTGVAPGSASIVITDNMGATVTVGVSVPVGSPLYTTAPSSLSVAIGAAPIYSVGGGTGPYLVTSNNTSVVTAVLAGSNLTITGVAVGSATVQVRDSAGAALTLAITVPTSSSVPLFVTAPSSITVGIGYSPVYTVGGGTGPYMVTSNDISVATAALTGSSLTVTGVYVGNAQLVIRDAAGTTLSISVTVPAATAAALYTTAPPSIKVAVGSNSVYSVGGGTGPYTAVSSDVSVATVALDVSDLTVSGIEAGNATIFVRDSVGSTINVSVVVGASPVAVSSSDARGWIGDLLVATITGGTPPYRASVGDAAVASALVVSQNQLEVIFGPTTGQTMVTVFDFNNQAAAVSITAINGSPEFRLSPTEVTVSENDTQPIRFSVFGAAPGSISIFSSDTTVLQAAISGNVVTVSAGSNGTRCFLPVGGDIGGAIYPITITAVDSSRAVGRATINLTNSAGGCP